MIIDNLFIDKTTCEPSVVVLYILNIKRAVMFGYGCAWSSKGYISPCYSVTHIKAWVGCGLSAHSIIRTRAARINLHVVLYSPFCFSVPAAPVYYKIQVSDGHKTKQDDT